jgi:hypothetical protein
MRLSRRLARNKSRLAPKHRAVSDTPPAQADATAKLRNAVHRLRSTARGDPAVLEIVSEAQRLIDSGWTERRGPFEPRRWPLHEAWGGKEPPDERS